MTNLYAFQGMEKDDENKGGGNSYSTYFRQLDPRLGRWLSQDPKMSSMPWQSPYCSMDNNPILFNDVLGDSITNSIKTKAAQASIKALMKTKEGLAEISKYADKGDVLFGHTFKSQGEYSKKGVDLILADSDVGTSEQASTRYYKDTDGGLVVHLNLNSNLTDGVNNGVKELNNSNRLRNYENNPKEHTKIWNTYIAYKTQTLAHEFFAHAIGDLKMWELGKSTLEMESNDDHDLMRNAFDQGSVAKIKTTTGFNIIIKKSDASSKFWESSWSISKQVHKNLNTGCSDDKIFNHLWEGL